MKINYKQPYKVGFNGGDLYIGDQKNFFHLSPLIYDENYIIKVGKSYPEKNCIVFNYSEYAILLNVYISDINIVKYLNSVKKEDLQDKIKKIILNAFVIYPDAFFDYVEHVAYEKHSEGFDEGQEYQRNKILNALGIKT